MMPYPFDPLWDEDDVWPRTWDWYDAHPQTWDIEPRGPFTADALSWDQIDAEGLTWDQEDAQGWTWDQPWREWLRRYLPRWLQGTLAQDVMGSAVAQLEAIAELHIARTWYVLLAGLEETPSGMDQLSYWERDYGIPTITTDTLEARRARILAKRRGQGTRNDADFINYARSLLVPLASGDPTPVGMTGLYVVYIPHDRGWVTNFADVQAGLRQVGPSHLGMFLAPWDDINGLTYDQMNQLAWVAANSLSFQQIEGAT